MLIKNEFAGYGLGLREQLEDVDNIILILALTYCFKVDKKIDYN